jgi:antitoxin component YwqK of YwqJK toxin-antitoxin module
MENETPKNGIHKVYYGNGRKSVTPFSRSTEVVENFKNGALHGKVTEREDIYVSKDISSGRTLCSGVTTYKCDYKNGLKDGIEVYFYSHYGGRYKERELTYKNGLLHGKETNWGSPSLHAKKSETNYKNNLLDGKYITWFNNGEKEFEGNYKNGKKDGKFISWYYNKQKRSEQVFKNDVLQDGSKFWYPNGKEKDEKIVDIEGVEHDEGVDYYIEDILSADDYAEYEKNYEGYDIYGDGTEEAVPEDDPFDEGLTDDERSLGRDFWKDIY